MLKRAISSLFSPFLPCRQICTSCAGNPGNLCKDCLLLPVSRHSCVLFSLSGAETPPIAQWFPSASYLRAAVCLQLSCSDPASLCTPDRTNLSCSPQGPWYTRSRFLTSPTEWRSSDLRCYAPCNCIFFLFSCSSYLSPFSFSQENFPPNDITSEHPPQWPWPR